MKKEIFKSLGIPVQRQKILFVGRTLADEKLINDYSNIKNGSKLTVVIKEPEPLKDIMLKIFKKYYSEEQSEVMTKELILDFENRLNQLNYDDVERMAMFFLDRDKKIYGDTI